MEEYFIPSCGATSKKREQVSPEEISEHRSLHLGDLPVGALAVGAITVMTLLLFPGKISNFVFNLDFRLLLFFGDFPIDVFFIRFNSLSQILAVFLGYFDQ